MMRRVILCLTVLVLLISCALAEPRYPEKSGNIHDAAAVLTKATVDDLNELSKLLSREDTLDLYVVTVDFLDGAAVTAYGEGLREKWALEEEDLLLLMAVGEDKYGFFGGSEVNRHLSSSAQQKLLSTHFAYLFLQQRYDEAIAALMPEVAREISKSYSRDIAVTGLFGTSSAEPENPDWIVRLSRRTGAEPAEPDLRERVSYEDEDTGFSFGKVVLTVMLLMIIFGKRGKRRGKGCGCGCSPFSSLLAWLGLWKLWGNDR